LTEWSDSFVVLRKAILLVGGSKSGVSERQFYRDVIRVADARFNAHRAAACRAAARPRFLNRRAWNVPVRTEHAAIARLRLQQAFASGTFIEISARVGWHCFGCLMPADWTGEHRDCSQSKHGRFNSSARRDNPRPSWREQARGARPWRRHKGRRSRDLSNGCGPPYDETRCEAMRRECPFLCFHRRNPPFPFRPVRKFKLTHYQEIC
jgi:hypothetical protein